MAKKILAFNWKMNPTSLKEAEVLFKEYIKSLKKIKLSLSWQVVVIPPFLYLGNFFKILKKEKGLKNKLFLGAQNCFWEEEGAFTGEISPLMLKNLGINYVVLGHSERRRYFKEGPKEISKKANKVLDLGLSPIICWGEQKKTENPRGYLAQILKNLPKTKELALAYEPIWAIGTGKPATPEYASKRNLLAKRIISSFKGKFKNYSLLYGGSVKAENIKDYLKGDYIDGFLIGGASLKKEEVKNIFKKIGKNETIKKL